MELEVQESKIIEDGKHEGIIVDVQYRTEPYAYTDVIIELKEMKIKAGYPTTLALGTKLADLMSRFGITLAVGQTVDPNEVLVGKPCQFMTIAETTQKGTFPKVLPDSVKPLDGA